MSETISILLVDDEARNLDALEAILDDPTYRLLRADDSEKALRLLLENDVAAIVLDIKMPGVSGIELAQLIKGTKKFRQIPIVFLTAYLVNDDDVVTGYGAGAVDYLTKPVNPLVLRHKVAVFADLFRKTRALAELNASLEARVQERTAELAKSEAALREADKQKDQFLATLAHELRNPLAPLRTGLDILLREPGVSARVERTMAAMNRQLDHTVRLVDDLLDVSRINRGTLEIRREQVGIASVIDRAMETVSPALARRDQRVIVDAPLDLQAKVDATRVAQIIGNLLSNASKHSPAGGVIHLDLRRAPKGDAVVRVRDEGTGIPADQLDRVFDMFAKVERATPEPNDGLGIGLALSRRLAELHGGTLAAASAGEGKGATFTLTFPTDVDARAPVVRDERHTPEPAAQAGLRIVLIEDNDDSADTMIEWLQLVGHDARIARSGPEGVALTLETRPDVVLCDIGLPGMDGTEVCRRIVAEMQTPPVMIAVTGWGMREDRRRTGEAGFKHHLVKPVALDKLQRLLRSIESARDEARSPRDGR